MYEHLVCFKFNERFHPDMALRLVDALKAFKGRIPGIVEVTAGVNVTEETANIHGYTLGLRVTFESQDALRDYGPHPVHQQFVKQLDGLVDNVVVMDYPITE
jgi:hypothetical protein